MAAREGKRKGSLVWRIVFWVALVVCLVSLGVLGYIFYGYWQAQQTYNDLASNALAVDDSSAVEPLAGKTLGDMTVDWDYLRAINPDVVAWIYMPGTAINYPVVKGGDNEYYLHTDFNGSYVRGGAIFLDYTNSGTFAEENNVIYGHHMNDGSMFACLSQQLVDQAEFNAHRDVYVLTPTMNYKCRSFALIITDGSDLLVQTTFADKEERSNYIRDKLERSVVQPDEGFPDPGTISRMVTLSTCDYSRDNGRAVMFTRVTDKAVPGSGSTGEPIEDADQAALDQGLAQEKEFSGELEPPAEQPAEAPAEAPAEQPAEAPAA